MPAWQEDVPGPDGAFVDLDGRERAGVVEAAGGVGVVRPKDVIGGRPGRLVEAVAVRVLPEGGDGEEVVRKEEPRHAVAGQAPGGRDAVEVAAGNAVHLAAGGLQELKKAAVVARPGDVEDAGALECGE